MCLTIAHFTDHYIILHAHDLTYNIKTYSCYSLDITKKPFVNNRYMTTYEYICNFLISYIITLLIHFDIQYEGMCKQ